MYWDGFNCCVAPTHCFTHLGLMLVGAGFAEGMDEVPLGASPQPANFVCIRDYR